jgi:hypothetical protein
VREFVLLKADYRKYPQSIRALRAALGPQRTFPSVEPGVFLNHRGADQRGSGKNRSAVLTNELSPMNRQNRMQGVHYLK